MNGAPDVESRDQTAQTSSDYSSLSTQVPLSKRPINYISGKIGFKYLITVSISVESQQITKRLATYTNHTFIG